PGPVASPPTGAPSAGLPAPVRRGDPDQVTARRDTAAAFETLRLRNTSRSSEELLRDDRALLLRNALIDTGVGTTLDIPEHLRARSEPGSYIVQSDGPVTPAFRKLLENAGATFISYLPNNAYLVEATAAQIGQ